MFYSQQQNHMDSSQDDVLLIMTLDEKMDFTPVCNWSKSVANLGL